MRIAYQYRLQPIYEQRFQMSRGLDMLRCKYNWMLSDRFDWWEMNRCRTFTFPQASHDWLEGNWVTLPKIGMVNARRKLWNTHQESGPGASAHYKTRIP